MLSVLDVEILKTSCLIFDYPIYITFSS